MKASNQDWDPFLKSTGGMLVAGGAEAIPTTLSQKQWASEHVAMCSGGVFVCRARKFEDCIAWARMRFQDYYHNRVAQVRGRPARVLKHIMYHATHVVLSVCAGT